MNRWFTKRSIVIVCACCFVTAAFGDQGAVESGIEKAVILGRTGKVEEAEKILSPLLTQETTAVRAAYELGLIYYELNEQDKAVKLFKDALADAFPQPASGKLQQAVELAKSGNTEDAEKMLLALLDNGETAARAAYELGLIYTNTGKPDKAAAMFRNALNIIADKGASYVGVKTCKICHLKEYKSWKNTKMAQGFETLKPGADAEIKKKLNLDPQKDYTKDTKCLECHTGGYGLPGGYKVPQAGDVKAAERAQENEGATCEVCHGPGSKYIAIHKNVMTKKQKYTLNELYEVGEYKVNTKTCTACHNSRNPTSGAGYQFDYEKFKAEDTHENLPLKYRKE